MYLGNNGNPYYNGMQNLYDMKDRIEQQIKNMEQQQINQQQFNQHQMPSAINQTFQITPNQNIPQNGNTSQDENSIIIKYVKNSDEVKNALTMNDTFFISENMDNLWFRNVKGNIRAFTLQEIIEVDPKDQKIIDLEEENKLLKEELRNAKSNAKPNGFTNEYAKNGKSSKVQRSNANDENK